MGRTLFIVSRHERDLYTYLRERFASDSAVEVILDRRIQERRKHSCAHGGDRRYADRRQRPEVQEELRNRSHAILTLPDLGMD